MNYFAFNTLSLANCWHVEHKILLLAECMGNYNHKLGQTKKWGLKTRPKTIINTGINYTRITGFDMNNRDIIALFIRTKVIFAFAFQKENLQN